MSANTILVISAINASLKTIQELNSLLMKAQMEGRDISDEEVAAYKLGNDSKSAELIGRLRSSGVG